MLMKLFLMRIILIILSIALTVQSFAQEAPIPEEKLKKTYRELLETKYVLLPHKQTYLLPFVYNQLPHESIYRGFKTGENTKKGDLYKAEEFEFQFSFLFPIYRKISKSNFDLNFAYTHHAWWQIYNSAWSRPFRETNYEPEIFIRYLDPGVKKLWRGAVPGVDFGYVHESNGQGELLSRSWNRLFVRSAYIESEFSALVTAWYRLKEPSTSDDNPDITNYMGYGELELVKNFNKHSFRFKTPLFAKHASTDWKYSYPWSDRLRWFVSMQFGYAHSMIEYNYPTQRYGVGIVIDNLWND